MRRLLRKWLGIEELEQKVIHPMISIKPEDFSGGFDVKVEPGTSLPICSKCQESIVEEAKTLASTLTKGYRA